MGDAPDTRSRTHVIRSCEFGGRAGVARGDITPPDGIYFRLWGSAKHDQPSGVHRPMLATAAALADASGKTQLVLVTDTKVNLIYKFKELTCDLITVVDVGTVYIGSVDGPSS